jgi:plastocyanin
MSRGILSAAVGLSLLMVPANPVSSGVGETVEVGDDYFDPATLPVGDERLIPGDGVVWAWADEVATSHNVRQVEGLFRSRISADPTMTYGRILSTGTFRYECEIHEPLMVGTVRVTVGLGITPTGLPVIRWAVPDSNTGRAFDVQFRIEDGPWRTWKKDTEQLKGVFGKNDKPVPFRLTRDYFIRARSQKSLARPDVVSGWSPPQLID